MGADFSGYRQTRSEDNRCFEVLANHCPEAKFHETQPSMLLHVLAAIGSSEACFLWCHWHCLGVWPQGIWSYSVSFAWVCHSGWVSARKGMLQISSHMRGSLGLLLSELACTLRVRGFLSLGCYIHLPLGYVVFPKVPDPSPARTVLSSYRLWWSITLFQVLHKDMYFMSSLQWRDSSYWCLKDAAPRVVLVCAQRAPVEGSFHMGATPRAPAI